MRITEKIINNGLTRNINLAMRQIDKRYNEISTGKKIQYPSDDPVGLISSLRLKDTINETKRYADNSDSAISWLEASDASLAEMNKVLNRLEELAVASANGHLTQESLNAYADEVHELKGHLLQIANTQLGSRYLFGGQQTNSPAYDDAYVYQGDDNQMKMEVGPGVSLVIGYTGNQVFGDFFTAMDNFEAHIRNGDIESIGTTDITIISQKVDNILDIRAAIGAKVNRLELSKERYSKLDIQFNKLLSETEDADLAESAMNLKMQETVYQAALASGARILQISMLNYLD
ncbi:MAG TPA: flagellar hook-associated protein FlgL [Bacillota bacterium]